MDVLLLLNLLFLVICVLVGIAFFTLLERKILGYIQIRSGPNKVGYLGLLQPFSDAIKLFMKELIWVQSFNYLPYYLSPLMGLGLMLLMWMMVPLWGWSVDFYLGLLFFISCSGFMVYILFGCGWSSNSKYAMLGALRAIAQSISYEVSFILILLSGVLLVSGYNLMDYVGFQKYIPFCLLMFPLFICWGMSCLAESNRSPFDFAEGESELVSGFNVEYSSGPFAFLFLAEYGGMLFISVLSEFLYFGTFMVSFGLMLMFIFSFIWMRGSLPRYRYDKLMYLAWKSYLPVSLNYLVFFIGLIFYIFW